MRKTGRYSSNWTEGAKGRLKRWTFMKTAIKSAVYKGSELSHLSQTSCIMVLACPSADRSLVAIHSVSAVENFTCRK